MSNFKCTNLFPPRDGHSECADSGSGGTRSMGYYALRIGERRIGRSVPLDDKHPLALPNLAFFKKKR